MQIICTIAEWREHGKDLARLPVDGVDLVDARTKPSGCGGLVWSWYHTDPLPAGCLWETLWDMIVAATGQSEWNNNLAALDALSAGCLAWARSDKGIEANNPMFVKAT